MITWRLSLLCGLANEDVLPAGPGNRTANQQQVFVGIHLDDFQVLRGDLHVAHVTRKMLVLPDARRERTAADAARSAMEHRTVRCVAAGIVPALHAAGKSAALADAGDIHQFAVCEVFHQHAIANLGFVFRFLEAHFLQDLHRSHVGLLEVPGHGLVDALRLDEFHEAELRGVVAVFCLGAALNHNARTRLQNGATHQVAVLGEDLRHAQLDSDNAVDCHVPFLSLAACPPVADIGCVVLNSSLIRASR